MLDTFGRILPKESRNPPLHRLLRERISRGFYGSLWITRPHTKRKPFVERSVYLPCSPISNITLYCRAHDD